MPMQLIGIAICFTAVSVIAFNKSSEEESSGASQEVADDASPKLNMQMIGVLMVVVGSMFSSM